MVDANSSAEEVKAEAHRLDGMEVRLQVLQTGLHLESIVNEMLLELLGIGEGKTLPIHQYQIKIKFLVLIGALDPEEKKLFDIFGDIRNQFVHNLKANTLEKCLEITNTKDKILAFGLETITAGKMDPNTVPDEGKLQIGLTTLNTKVIKRAQKIRQLAMDRRFSKMEGDLSKDFIGKLHPNIYAPINNAAEKVAKGDQTNYTKEEVQHLLYRTSIDLKDAMLAMTDEIVLASINAERKKKGVPPLDKLPESDISRRAKEFGH